jgi:aerobic-type carbon monoxide dehydrogenase small subunit (CoxS/CutS family)
MIVRFTLNGAPAEVKAPPLAPLARVLRETLGLTGTKLTCAEGRCGSCTVLLDGRPVVSCLMPVVSIEGAALVTIEGVAGADGALHPAQRAMLEHDGVQCGICTPGMVMSIVALLAERPRATEAEIRSALAGNLCRCTGYRGIVEAALSLTSGPAPG